MREPAREAGREIGNATRGAGRVERLRVRIIGVNNRAFRACTRAGEVNGLDDDRWFVCRRLSLDTVEVVRVVRSAALLVALLRR